MSFAISSEQVIPPIFIQENVDRIVPGPVPREQKELMWRQLLKGEFSRSDTFLYRRMRGQVNEDDPDSFIAAVLELMDEYGEDDVPFVHEQYHENPVPRYAQRSGIYMPEFLDEEVQHVIFESIRHGSFEYGQMYADMIMWCKSRSVQIAFMKFMYNKRIASKSTLLSRGEGAARTELMIPRRQAPPPRIPGRPRPRQLEESISAIPTPFPPGFIDQIREYTGIRPRGPGIQGLADSLRVFNREEIAEDLLEFVRQRVNDIFVEINEEAVQRAAEILARIMRVPDRLRFGARRNTNIVPLETFVQKYTKKRGVSKEVAARKYHRLVRMLGM